MSEPLIFELKRCGKRSYCLPLLDTPEVPLEKFIPKEYIRDVLPPLPALSEPEVVRHFTRLSRLNYSVDTTMYPLGSCTMKYNPKVNDYIARDKKWQYLHPYFPLEISQGILKLLYEMQIFLCEICGMDGITLQPPSGASGEFTGLLLIRAYHNKKGEVRNKIIVPDSSHGTNPSSAHMAGFSVITIPSDKDGGVDINELTAKLDNTTAALMLTNPNTLGYFEKNIIKIAGLVHKHGALLYGDGANLNAFIGRIRPGDIGFDLMHLNLHKTFSTPHGGGGPGAGPVVVKKNLLPFLPAPIIGYKDKKYYFDYNIPDSIGRLHSFYGNIGVIVRAYAYIRALGSDGLAKVSGYAVLNANYMRKQLEKEYCLPYKGTCMHEFVLSAKKELERGISAKDIAKRLLDYGFYAPTIYFPLIVPEALMIEPTETESKTTLDEFISALLKISREDPLIVKNAPSCLPVTRLDEVTAAKIPDLRWEESQK